MRVRHSGPELEAAFASGLNSRGAVPPWAVVLQRKLLWGVGFRPVIYADSGSAKTHQKGAERAHGPGWEALVVSTNPLDDGRDDWTHEREWRFCYPAGEPKPQVDIQTAIRAIIVGEPGWVPSDKWIVPETFGSAPLVGVDFRVRRWLWDKSQRRLVHDGELVVERKARSADPG